MISYKLALRERVELHPGNGNNVFILCPFHSESDASCSVNLDHGGFHCFGCQEEGPFYKLISCLDGISEESAKILWRDSLTTSFVKSTVKDIKKEMHLADSEEDVTINNSSFSTRFTSLGSTAKRYLQSRHLSDSTANLFGIRWGGVRGRWRNRIVIPMYDVQANLRAFSGRTVIKGRKPKTMKHGSVKDVLFGESIFADGGKLPYVILVEGEIDCMYLLQLGYFCLAAMGTSGFVSKKGEVNKKRLRTLLSVTSQVYISYDGDEGGRVAAKRDQLFLSSFIPTVRINFIDSFDPNSLGIKNKNRLYSLYRDYGIKRRDCLLSGGKKICLI